MRIYFSGSISGGRQDVELYRRIVGRLKDDGHDVISGEVANPRVKVEGERIAVRAVFDRDLQWIEEVADAGGVLVAEVSQPSLGVGYEIAAARYRYDLAVVCLWRPAYVKRCSAMIAGDPRIHLIEYGVDDETAMLDRLGRILKALGTA